MATNGTIPLDTEQALVEWINSFPLTTTVFSLAGLNNGRILWEMLGQIDGQYFSENLPNTEESYYARHQNIEYMLARVRERLSEEGKSYNNFTEEDVHEMAAKDSAEQVTKFIRMILLVMLSSPILSDLVATIQTLSEPTQQAVGTLMQEVAPEITPNEVTAPSEFMGDGKQSETMAPTPPEADQRVVVLHLEEQYAKVASQLERSKRDYTDLEEEHHAVCETLGRSQATNDALGSQIVERDEQLKKLSSLNSQREQSSVRELETKISQQEELISNRESELTKTQLELHELHRDKKKLLEGNDRLQKLQDEYDATKLELEKQSRKANTVDKYMQKLQASHAVERERDALRQELEEARTELTSTANLRMEKHKMQKTNDEVSRTLAQIEREHGELHMTNKQLRLKCGRLSQQVDDLNDRFAQDQETIAEFREGKSENEAPASPSRNGQLDGELLMSSERETNMKSRLSTLEKELVDRDTTVTNLRQQRDTAKAVSEEHLMHLQKLRQDTVVLETSLGQVHRGHPMEGTEIFKRMRDKCKINDVQRSQLENDIITLREEIRRLNLGEKSSLQNSTSLEATQSSDRSESFEAHEKQSIEETDLVQSKIELDEKYHQTLNEKAAETARQQELETASSANNLVNRDPPSNPKNSHDNLVNHSKQVAGVDNGDARNIYGDREADSDRPSYSSNLEPQTRSYIHNLERENRLMASAYHDIASRLQMHNVTLQRRAEPPKNWLGRQRRALEGPSGLVR